MKAKDVAFISVLINMALLIMLFFSALQPKSVAKKEEQLVVNAKKEEKVNESLKEKNFATLNQVDSLLNKFMEEEVKKQEIVPPLSEKERGNVSSILSDHFQEYIVKKGDSLEKIARNHHVSIYELMKKNRLLESDKIHVGQILYLPNTTEKSVKEVSAPEFYVVRPGDNPWTIAMKYGIKVEDLMKLNRLNDVKAKQLRPGDKLQIR